MKTKEEIEADKTIAVYPAYGSNGWVFNAAMQINQSRKEKEGR